jgi:hypothetical protein
MKPIDNQAWSMAQTSPQMRLEPVEPPHLLLIAIPFDLRAGGMMLVSAGL